MSKFRNKKNYDEKREKVFELLSNEPHLGIGEIARRLNMSPQYAGVYFMKFRRSGR